LNEQELLQQSQNALKAGNTQQASAILAKLVQQHPKSEQGWYLLGTLIKDKKQKKYCFDRALAINPNNIEIHKQLTLLDDINPASQPTGQPVSKPVTAPIKPSDSKPSYTYTPQTNAEDDRTNIPVAISELHKKLEEPHSQPISKKKPAKKKNNNRVILITAFASIAVLICTTLVGLSILSSRNILLPSANLPDPSFSPIPLAATWTAPAPAEQVFELLTSIPTQTYTPMYQESQCLFEAPNQVKVTCGYVTVPESRAGNPADSIRLAVAVFRSTSNNPAPDPIVFLQGGPGGAAVELSAQGYEVVVQPFINERDFIVFDQRGTGLSEPNLKCDELDKVYFQDIYGTIEDSTRELVYQNAFFSCGGFHRSNGINLQAYSTVENAADLRDVVNVLGYEKVNLFGVSYGTRLALVTMRNHPEIVRSAILDSVVPVEMNLLHEYPNSVNATLQKIFETCMLDVECNTAYPELEKVFWELINQLDARPITLTTSAYPIGSVTETIDGYYVLSVILGLARNEDFINTAPQTIYRVKNGDYTTITLAQYTLPYAFDGVKPALYISTMCREHVLASTKEELKSISETLDVDSAIWRPFYGSFEEMYNACKTWGSVGPDFGENDAVISDIPSIIIEGSFDPATPPFMGKQVAANLTNSFYFEFPNAGHVPSLDDPEGCAMQVTLEFIRNPLTEPNRNCLNDIKTVDFLVPYTGEPALELKTINAFGVNVKVPKDWYFDDGFYVRYSSPFDITQIGAFRTLVTVQELKDYFSSSVYGYRGFDGAPIESGVLQFNGLTWKLYYTTSNGRPVDIAATQDGNTSLVVIMFTHPDEHDAFYRTLFLPMVESAR
jgi:pimeloyl-ACP methyl ester carboxylesterase